MPRLPRTRVFHTSSVQSSGTNGGHHICVESGARKVGHIDGPQVWRAHLHPATGPVRVGLRGTVLGGAGDGSLSTTGTTSP
jgi:hypothetical protein